MAEAVEAARRRAEVPIAPTDQDNVALAERLSGSLVSTTAMQLKTEGVPLHAIPIDGVAPTLANTESGTYRYTKKLHIIVRSPESAAVAKFVAFLRSPSGSTLLRDAEAIPETK
jgi:phosphate transport system substrate-binding protein